MLDRFASAGRGDAAAADEAACGEGVEGVGEVVGVGAAEAVVDVGATRPAIGAGCFGEDAEAALGEGWPGSGDAVEIAEEENGAVDVTTEALGDAGGVDHRVAAEG